MKNIAITLFLSLFFYSFSQSPPVEVDNVVPSGFGDHPVAQGPETDLKKWQMLATLDLKSKKPNKKLQLFLKKKLEITGFIIPIEYEKKQLSEFLFVPYVPSCMHVPPPADNQIIHVKFKKSKKLETPWFPIKLTGTLSVNKNSEAEAIYSMKVKKFSVVKL